VPGSSERLRLPNPQAPDTLPVAARGGRDDRISGIRFDLLAHGVPRGATITRFVLTIAEGNETDERSEQPEFNNDKKVIEACPITSGWTQGAAELWKDRPQTRGDGCVVGVRHKARPPTWTFDLTALARDWARNPFLHNDGVMFVPVMRGTQPGHRTWQVNLKIPSRDDPKTKQVDEYQRTRGRTSVTITFTRPEPRNQTGSGGFGGSGSGSGTVNGGSNPFGAPIGGGGSGTVKGGSNPPPPFPTPAPTPTAGGGGGSDGTTLTSPPPIPTVRFPWYAWVLLPVAILCLAAVRSVLFEQTRAGVRPNGVVSSIRERNATAGRAPQGAMAALLARARKAKESSSPEPVEP
jgi:hypothetical protein